MSRKQKTARVIRTMYSSTRVPAARSLVWDEITNVDIHSFPHPRYFRFLGIPDPLRAEIVDSGVGGKRIAYFNTGKRFIQRILVWNPPEEYGFEFNPEPGFKVVFIFDLADGLVQIPTGSYLLTEQGSDTSIRLGTEYSIDKRFAPVLTLPVQIVLKGFQRYLLKAIARNTLTTQRAINHTIDLTSTNSLH